MPHENEQRPRGRPRAFDESAVRGAAIEAFWTNGFAGVSLDDLTAKTGVARPSLAAAFGSKRDLYLASVEHFVERLGAAAEAVLTGAKPLREELAAFYEGAMQLYLSGKAPRGCLAICTLPAEAAHDEEIRKTLKSVIDAAGQRNTSALHYHFGGRRGLLDAIIDASNAARSRAWIWAL